MRKKSFLSYEAKIILLITGILLLIFLPLPFYDNFIKIKDDFLFYYDEYIAHYPIWLQVVPFILPIIIYLLVKIIKKNRSEYTEDTFYNIKWTWNWNKDNITNLHCYCPDCNEEIYYDDTTSNFTLKVSKLDFICDKCEKVVGSIANENKKFNSSTIINKEIERQVFRKLAENKNLAK